ncbi:MAG: hypothetical protein ACFB16_10565 [Phormidesmis sp.]
MNALRRQPLVGLPHEGNSEMLATTGNGTYQQLNLTVQSLKPFTQQNFRKEIHLATGFEVCS